MAERLGPFVVGPEQRRLLRGEVVEKGARRDVGRFGNVLHGHMRVAALGDQAEGDPADGAARGELLALTQGGTMQVERIRALSQILLIR